MPDIANQGAWTAWLLGGMLCAVAAGLAIAFWSRTQRTRAAARARRLELPGAGAPRLPGAFPGFGEPRQAPAPREAAWQQYTHGMLSVQRFDPDDASRQPWAGLDGQACIDRLGKLQGHWSGAEAHALRQHERRCWLDVVLALLDHDVVRPLHDGRLPDPAALRTERLLLGADQGPVVLSEVSALFARRLRLALDRLPPARRGQAEARWRLLGELCRLMKEAGALDQRSRVIQALAWNPEVDLDQVEVAYALAGEYRLQLRDWLQRAASVAVPETGLTLDRMLLAACPLLESQGEDDIGYVDALRPLHAGFTELARTQLAQLVLQAARVEQEQGLQPLSGDVPLAQGAPA